MKLASTLTAAAFLLVATPGIASAEPTTTTTPPTSTTTSAPPSVRASGTTSTTTTTTTTPPTACELTPETAGKGELLWGFKKSFRQYVGVGIGNATGNSITATDGAVITNVDEVVRDGVPNPTGVPTGAYRFAFRETTYHTTTDFTVKYRGKVTFAYPAHFFTLILGDPWIAATSSGTTLHADIELRAQPGAPAQSVNLPDVTLANLNLAGGSQAVNAGVLTWSAVAATLTSSEAFAGFYRAGTALDPVTLTIGADCAKLPDAPPSATTGVVQPQNTSNNLVPQVRFRPTDEQQLANTGSDVEHALWLGVSLLLAGLAVVLAAYRPSSR